MALLLVLLLLLIDRTASAAYPPTAPGDVKALCELYFATGGANWMVNTGFNTCSPNGTASSDPCGNHPWWKWDDTGQGVSQCDRTGQSSRVTVL